jgi:Flp pilus assembly pilin Flp
MSRPDRGAAVVEFALVGALLTVLAAAVVQLALALHVRNTLVDCASEGARYGAFADRDPQAGAERARELIAADLSPAYAEGVTAGFERFGGVDTVVVRVSAPLPVAGLVGVGRVVEVSGHAVAPAP